MRILFVALLLVAAAAPAETLPDLSHLFPYERVVELPGPGVARLTLPPEVLKQTRSDLSDVRLFDADGREIPFLIDTVGWMRESPITLYATRETLGVRDE